MAFGSPAANDVSKTHDWRLGKIFGSQWIGGGAWFCSSFCLFLSVLREFLWLFFFFGFCLLRSAHLSAFILADGDWLLRVVLDVVSSMRCRAVSEPQPLPGTPRAGWR